MLGAINSNTSLFGRFGERGCPNRRYAQGGVQDGKVEHSLPQAAATVCGKVVNMLLEQACAFFGVPVGIFGGCCRLWGVRALCGAPVAQVGMCWVR